MSTVTLGQAQSPAFEQPLNSQQVAAMFKVHFKTLERKARSGEVPAHFKFGRWLYFGSELDSWVKGEIKSGSQSDRVN